MAEMWETIDKAPKDGTIVRARDHAGNESTAAYRDGSWWVAFPPGGLMGGSLWENMRFNAREFTALSDTGEARRA
jgi:hypothetical protein